MESGKAITVDLRTLCAHNVRIANYIPPIMRWIYSFPNSKAVKTDTNTTFHVELKRAVYGIDDFELRAVSGSQTEYSAEELREFKEELWAMHLQDEIRLNMRSLVDKEFDSDCQLVAYKLSTLTGRRISNRTVQAWLIEPGKTSSRTCPEWALKALKEFIADPANKDELEERRKYARKDASAPLAWSSEVDRKHSVEFATNQILADQQRLGRWQKAGFDSLPSLLAELERKTEGYLNFLHERQLAYDNALKSSSTFDEFKSKALDAIRDKDIAEFLVKEARRAIENKTHEFASDDGVPEQ